MAPVSLSRYRPAVLILTGVSAAFAVYLIRQHYFGNDEPMQSSLRRRNAVRHSRRRRRGSAAGCMEVETITDRAIINLLAREASGTGYGSASLEGPGEGHSLEWTMLPSKLPTLDVVRGAVPEEEVSSTFQNIHETFVLEFLSAEYPGSFFINSDDMERLRRQLVDLGVNATAVERAINTYPQRRGRLLS